MQALATKALHKVFESLSRRDDALRELCQQCLGTPCMELPSPVSDEHPPYLADDLAAVSPDEAG